MPSISDKAGFDVPNLLPGEAANHRQMLIEGDVAAPRGVIPAKGDIISANKNVIEFEIHAEGRDFDRPAHPRHATSITGGSAQAKTAQ
jgi:hypothetical protein